MNSASLVFFILILFIISNCDGTKSSDIINQDGSTGINLIQNGSYENGLSLLLDYVKENSTDPDVWNSIGFAYNNLGLYEQALEPLSRATSIDPMHSYAWTNTGGIK